MIVVTVLKGDKDWNNLLQREDVGNGIDGFTVNQVILQDECSRLIAETETMGYSFWNPDRLNVSPLARRPLKTLLARQHKNRLQERRHDRDHQ